MTGTDPNMGAESATAGRTTTGREEPSRLRWMLRRGLTSGVFAGVGGGIVLWSGLRAFRRGKQGRGILSLLAGTVLITVGARQRQSSGERSVLGGDVDQRDVVDTSPDIEDVEGAGMESAASGRGESADASGDAAQAATESSIDIEDVSDGLDEDATGTESVAEMGEDAQTGDDAETEDGNAKTEGGNVGTEDGYAQMGDEGTGEEGADDEVGRDASGIQIDFGTATEESPDRIGEGTFDERRGVPVPEPAFEDEFLETDDEAFWGIREQDDAVFVSHHRIVFDESEGVEYITSSEVDDERLLSVPDVVLDHWAGVAGDEPMADADELVFAVTDDLRQGAVLWVVPVHRADEWFEQ